MVRRILALVHPEPQRDPLAVGVEVEGEFAMALGGNYTEELLV